MLTVYTKNICGKCLLLKSELEAKNKAFQEINMDHDEAAREVVKEKGFMSAPVIEENDEFKTFEQVMAELDGL